MKRIIVLVLALVASTAVGATVDIPIRSPGGGAIVKGSTTGGVVATGNVGELKAGYTSSLNNMPASGLAFDAQSQVLGVGVYLCYGRVQFFRQSATFTSVNFTVGFGATSGNNLPITQPITRIDWFAVAPTSFNNFTAVVGPIQIRSDGTNLFYGASTQIGTGNTLYLKGYADSYTGTPQYLAFMECVRGG